MANNRSLLAGLVVGGIVGGAAVLFSAPTSGKELRGQLKSNCGKLEETVQKLKNDGSSLTEQIVTTAKEGIEVVKEVSGELQNSIKTWREEIKPHQQDLQKELAEIEEKIKQLEKNLQK
ncbi:MULTISPECIES: YtxH domain-containing protein [Bacillus]|uniref:General stress protein n=2 Tax=Bacillus TaxID=1386 RepID=A0A0M4G6S4_9BACI|nr:MULTISPECIES: YtxH domain-containing protein [Bacillus]ALC80615.1 hypothetical protein AM592_02725 [Bacillus gobiensis]MBP1083712.1 gas vesicle protein [Bacillus capparidis]MED1094900.1 YtxH domain-containing protein [Bacillus capparidis]